MSATMDVDHFSKYFNNCKTIYLVGRTYPIKVMHAKEPQEDYKQASLTTLFQIHESAPPKWVHYHIYFPRKKRKTKSNTRYYISFLFSHDVLVFLTGQEEIETMVYQIRALTKVRLNEKEKQTRPIMVLIRLQCMFIALIKN